MKELLLKKAQEVGQSHGASLRPRPVNRWNLFRSYLHDARDLHQSGKLPAADLYPLETEMYEAYKAAFTAKRSAQDVGGAP